MTNSEYHSLVAQFRQTTRHAVTTPRKAQATGYSYQRFSTPGQADGDSLKRQTRLRDDWLQRNPHVRLDDSLIDAGVSGYTGRHRMNRKHALAAFMDQVRRGRVLAGSYLLVENLDRLSREHPFEVMALVAELVRAGIRVVQLDTGTVFDANMSEGDMFQLLAGATRGHGESKRKSSLCGSAWQDKKNEARARGTPYGRNVPSWLELDGDHYRVKEDAAAAVRQIFQWCVAGHGAQAILAKLQAAGIRPIGRSGRWERSFIHLVLRSESVRGTYTPHVGGGGRNRKPDGDPIPSYFPRVVDDRLWFAAQAAVEARTRRSGRPATASNNPFSGLLVSAADGTRLHVCHSRGYAYLVNSGSIQRAEGSERQAFPLKPLVTAVLSQLRELRAADLFSDPGGSKVAELTGRLAAVEKRLAVAVARFKGDPESKTWSDMVTQSDLEKRSLVKERDLAQREAANPLSANWAEAVALMAAKEPERLRAALLACVEAIHCLFVPKGRDRLAACRVQFKGSNANRSYLIVHRPAAGSIAPRPETTATWSFAEAVPSAKSLDLRKPEHAERLRKTLESVPAATWGNGE
jgi:DNA invertase Pin-like site-specific DNA recombinase